MNLKHGDGFQHPCVAVVPVASGSTIFRPQKPRPFRGISLKEKPRNGLGKYLEIVEPLWRAVESRFHADKQRSRAPAPSARVGESEFIRPARRLRRLSVYS